MIYIRDSRLGLLAALLKERIVDGGNLNAGVLYLAVAEVQQEPPPPSPICTLCGKPYWSEEADGECGCPWLALLGAENAPHVVGADDEESE